MVEEKIKKTRSSNIELLRIFCTFMVITLHLLNPSILGGIKFAKESGSLYNTVFMTWLFCFSVSAVDIFILISGYFMINNNQRKIGKAINLLFVCGAYRELKYLFSCFFLNGNFSVNDFLYNLFPKSYYVFLYCVLYIISPYINLAVSSLDKRNYKKLLMILLFFFSIWCTVIDCYQRISGRTLTDVYTISADGNGRGFTLVNFVLLYLIGGYIKKFGIDFFKKRSVSLLVGILCSVINCMICLFLPELWGTNGILGYEMIFVIIQAVALFDFFTKINIGSIKIINFLARTSFGVFLLHTVILRYLLKWIDMSGLFHKGFLSAVLCYGLLLLSSYIISGLFDSLAHFLMKPVSKFWSKTKIFNFGIFC